MALLYTILAANRTVDVRSSTLVEDVEEVHVRTKPSGATFVRLVPYKAWLAKGAGGTIEIIAQHIEHIFTERPHVTSGDAVQSVDSQGLIVNAVEFTVELPGSSDSQPGPFRTTVTIPVQVLHDDETFDRWFTPALEALRATIDL